MDTAAPKTPAEHRGQIQAHLSIRQAVGIVLVKPESKQVPFRLSCAIDAPELPRKGLGFL